MLCSYGYRVSAAERSALASWTESSSRESSGRRLRGVANSRHMLLLMAVFCARIGADPVRYIFQRNSNFRASVKTATHGRLEDWPSRKSSWLQITRRRIRIPRESEHLMLKNVNLSSIPTAGRGFHWRGFHPSGRSGLPHASVSGLPGRPPFVAGVGLLTLCRPIWYDGELTKDYCQNLWLLWPGSKCCVCQAVHAGAI